MLGRHITGFCGGLALILLLLTRSLSAGEGRSHETEPVTQARFRVVGYIPEYRMSSLDPAVAKEVTDLVYFSAQPVSSGELDTKRLRPEHIQALRKMKDEHGIALFLCVGGWGRSAGFAPLAASPPARERFVAEVTRFCQENHFDGIDLDWEHPANESQARDYGALLAAIKGSFAPKKLELTVAAAGWQALSAQAIEAVDRVNLMSYDANGRHSTFEFAKADVARMVKNGVPPSKICLGVPFYGRGVEDRSKSLGYREIVRKYNPGASVDEVDRIYFNGIETIERKTRYALESGLGGIMIWELGHDTRDEHSLLRAIHRIAAGSEPKKGQ
jgi:chitinase